MTVPRSRLILLVSAMILAGALLSIRFISAGFDPMIETEDHPVMALTGLLILAGTAWFILLLLMRRTQAFPKWGLPVLILGGLILRLGFFGSQPIYENDYKRYLWDGAVTAQGENPYIFTPEEIFDASAPGTASVPDLATLAVLSNEADGLTGEINSPHLTTIYPPFAQAVFASAYWIAPYNPDGLRGVFLIFEMLGFAVLLLALKQFGMPLIWSSLYWLNPIIILTSYNAIHMDVLLTLPLLLAVLTLKARPWIAAIALSAAAAIKLWPLLLAPVLFRSWFKRPALYIGIAALVAVLTSLSLLPMLLSLNDQAGLAAYSANWTNSSFLFPGLREALSFFVDDPNRIARYVIALILVGLSLYLGFSTSRSEKKLPFDLMALSAAFVLLSPTGYPWYFIWFFMFLPFAVQSWMARGLGLLTIGATAYYVRFLLGETDRYEIYETILLPLEFGTALLVLAYDGWKERRYA